MVTLAKLMSALPPCRRFWIARRGSTARSQAGAGEPIPGLDDLVPALLVSLRPLCDHQDRGD